MPSQHGAPAPQHDSTIMQTIVLANAKGGTGKSTLAAGLAVAASQAGETVIALDLDPQGSLGRWGDAREASAPAVDRIEGTRLAQLPQLLTALAQRGFTIAILDTPGIDFDRRQPRHARRRPLPHSGAAVAARPAGDAPDH